MFKCFFGGKKNQVRYFIFMEKETVNPENDFFFLGSGAVVFPSAFSSVVSSSSSLFLLSFLDLKGFLSCKQMTLISKTDFVSISKHRY